MEKNVDENYESLKKKARALYEEGKIDEAIEIVRGLPKDDKEVHELNRALRYADEGRSIVSNVSIESEANRA
jgi:hypothetical protein